MCILQSVTTLKQAYSRHLYANTAKLLQKQQHNSNKPQAPLCLLPVHNIQNLGLKIEQNYRFPLWKIGFKISLFSSFLLSNKPKKSQLFFHDSTLFMY